MTNDSYLGIVTQIIARIVTQPPVRIQPAVNGENGYFDRRVKRLSSSRTSAFRFRGTVIEVVRHTIRVTVLVMHKGSPGRWPVGREVVMEDILIVRLLEIEEEGVGPAGATRP